MTTPDENVSDALLRLEEILTPFREGKAHIFTPEEVNQITALMVALGPDGVRIVEQIIQRERQSLAIKAWLHERRARWAAVSGWIMGALAFLYAVRDAIADIWAALW